MVNYMKKIILNNIEIFIGCIIGMLIATTTIVCAYSFSSASTSYAKSAQNEVSVEEALNELYQIQNAGTATAGDILPGKTAWSNGQMRSGTYKTPAITLTYQVGGYTSQEQNHQTRINLNYYSALYKYFKILGVSEIDTGNYATGYYINKMYDTYSTNMSFNTQYLISDYSQFVFYTSGNPGYLYQMQIQLYN